MFLPEDGQPQLENAAARSGCTLRRGSRRGLGDDRKLYVHLQPPGCDNVVKGGGSKGGGNGEP